MAAKRPRGPLPKPIPDAPPSPRDLKSAELAWRRFAPRWAWALFRATGLTQTSREG